MALGADAFALDWDFEPYVGGSAIYTDNQNSSENDPQDALILTLKPGFSLRSEGSRRLQAGMDYSVTGVARFGDDLDNDAYQNLRALGNAELMEDLLFIDGTASISQQLISLSGSQVDASVNSSNRTSTGTYTISPYVTQRFGNYAEGLARFTQSGALFRDNAFDNINSSIFNASLASGTRFNDLSWGLNYFWRNAVVQNSEDARFESYGANLGYALTPRFRLLATAGYDNNDYTSVPGSEISGSYWTAGFDWAPNVRTNLGASIGESYFGRTYGLNFNYRTRNTVWTANYDDGVSDISQQLLNTQPLFVWSCDGGLFFGDGVLPPQGQSNCVPQGAAPAGSVPIGLQNGIFLNKRFRAGVAWSKARTSLGLDLFNTIRQYQQIEGLPEDEVWGGTLSYGYRLQPLSNLYARLYYSNYYSPAGLESLLQQNTDYYSASLGVNHQFGRDLSGALTFRHSRQDSNLPGDSYDENSITATANMAF
jgi:uncharacterized protein (PEP-CTERM system associated)